ncbi:L,D-peptidoglycan transpeptidase YkuD, ErfK/YbiS/YcfS/YnhG family [Clostridium cavendishii DSM 21758]|uniref:L,D-peptidoglycan transpeptidase YkuD, ErfK/YbiS/YcfS/YnhG family n=1 Tax=Clostridium cavendishii DSM 21758 TaxID=1121302 RepID=A0A1M6FCL4_9CLOT|nr:hypothetical protein [Clostridium cavendishii]SHI95386.1 L,D-peptidoglycan transpeptidase YkuD, ErfK/YbiS/YcfS/YnhG family [Clostridium cavendishii DSM 21758]
MKKIMLKKKILFSIIGVFIIASSAVFISVKNDKAAKSAEEQKKLAMKKLEEDNLKEEDKKKDEELKKIEEQKKDEELKKIEEQKKEEELKKEEDKKKEEEKKQQEEAQKVSTNKTDKQEKQNSNTTEKVKTKKGFKNPAFANSSQILLVTANSMGSSSGVAREYEKDSNGEWNVVKGDMAVRLGANGLQYISKRQQSTNKTPAGILNIISAFGVGGNPGCSYSYKKVEENDYWNLNSGSQTYNRLINHNPGGDYEHLASYQAQYKYALVTDYNINQAPNKGGAIFLHCNGRGATGGCVSFNEADMVQVMKWMDSSRNPKVLIIPSGDLGQYYY